MRRGLVITVLLTVASTAVNSTGQDARSDRERLQGTWAVVALERDGCSAPRAYCETLVLTFAGDKVTLASMDGRGTGLEHTFRLDPAKLPRVMDLVVSSGSNKGRVLPGIYEFDGDQLEMSHADGGATERPTDFRSPPGTFHSVMVVTRVRKK